MGARGPVATPAPGGGLPKLRRHVGLALDTARNGGAYDRLSPYPPWGGLGMGTLMTGRPEA
jgi:hypothetical protein